jgi:hypothetical protein
MLLLKACSEERIEKQARWLPVLMKILIARDNVERLNGRHNVNNHWPINFTTTPANKITGCPLYLRRTGAKLVIVLTCCCELTLVLLIISWKGFKVFAGMLRQMTSLDYSLDIFIALNCG